MTLLRFGGSKLTGPSYRREQIVALLHDEIVGFHRFTILRQGLKMAKWGALPTARPNYDWNHNGLASLFAFERILSRFRQWPSSFPKHPLDVFAEVGSVFVPIWVVAP